MTAPRTGLAGAGGTLRFRNVLGMRVDATSYEDASFRIVQWAQEERSAYVCVANVHMANVHGVE